MRTKNSEKDLKESLIYSLLERGLTFKEIKAAAHCGETLIAKVHARMMNYIPDKIEYAGQRISIYDHFWNQLDEPLRECLFRLACSQRNSTDKKRKKVAFLAIHSMNPNQKELK